MSFVWQPSYQPPSEAALDRMRRAFPQPSEPMPEAWFMGSEVNFWTITDDHTPEELAVVLHETEIGIRCFPQSGYVDVWKAWFRYLLPRAINQMNTTQDNNWNPSLLEGTFGAFRAIYPQQIRADYEEFRDDVVYTLGTRILPEVWSRDDPALKLPDSASLQSPVFNNIWDLTNSPDLELPGTFDMFDLPVVFCLTYLTPPEIESWVESLLQIDSSQWYLAIMTWWLKCYPTVLADPLVSQNNLTTFNAAMTRCLSIEMFQRWSAHIQKFQIFQYRDESFPIGDDLSTSIQQTLQNFQKEFFGG